MSQRKHPYRNTRSMAQRSSRELEDEMNLFYNEWLVVENIGYCSQNATSIDSIPTRKKGTEYPCEEKQKFSRFQTNEVIFDSAPEIKIGILDSLNENQELNSPTLKYPQCVPTIYPRHAVKTENQVSSKTNKKHPLPSKKDKYAQIDHVCEPSRTKIFHSECLKNRKTENSITVKYNLPKCSVLLHDCLNPKNLDAILTSFKSLKINKSVSESYPKAGSSPMRNSPYLFHVFEGDKKGTVSSTYKEKSYLGTYKKIPTSKKEQKLRVNQKIYLNNIKKKKARSDKSNYICNCSKTRINESQLHENFESTQQLCSCLIGVNKLSGDLTPSEIQVKETLFFNPDFGKITCGINKIN